MNNKPTRSKGSLVGALLLLLAAMIWGTTFAAQSEGADKIAAFTFNGVRMLIGALTLTLFLLIRSAVLRRGGRDAPDPDKRREQTRITLRGGFFVGLALFGASTAQQSPAKKPRVMGTASFV